MTCGVGRCLLLVMIGPAKHKVPLHSVIKLSPKAYGCQSELIRFDVASVSTHRPKPEVPGQLEKRLEFLVLLPCLIIYLMYHHIFHCYINMLT